MPTRGVEVVKFLARNPAGEIHRIGEAQALAQIVQRTREESVQPAYRQAELRPLAMEFGEGAQQAVQVLVRMQSGNRQQKRLGMAAAASSKKTGSTPSRATRTFFSGSR